MEDERTEEDQESRRGVDSWEDYLPEYRALYLHVLQLIAAMPHDTPIEEKDRKYLEEIERLRVRFELSRNEDYAKKEVRKTKNGKCANGVPGRVKDCGTKWLKGPKNGMVVTKSVRFSGKGIKAKIVKRNAVGIKMRATGKKTNKARTTAKFVYVTNYVKETIAREFTMVMQRISSGQKH